MSHGAKSWDGWPLCPRCGDDELMSVEIRPEPTDELRCLACGWTGRVSPERSPPVDAALFDEARARLFGRAGAGAEPGIVSAPQQVRRQDSQETGPHRAVVTVSGVGGSAEVTEERQ